jgi:hypothetical protein
MTRRSAKPTLADSVRELEQLDIRNDDKIELLLVLAGEKPATSWWQPENIYGPGQLADHRGRKKFDAVVAWAKRTGLPYEVTDERINPARQLYSGIEGQQLMAELAAKGRPVDVDAEIAAAAEKDLLTLFIAKDKDWLSKLRTADNTRDPQLLGECFGFPPAAVAAYVGQRALNPDRVRVPLRTRAFAHFMLSRDHTQEDLATAARWADTVERLSPKLYAEAIESESRRARLKSRQLRIMLLATALLLIPGIGQFVAIHDINTSGRLSDLAILFKIAGIFIIPTSIILSVAIIMAVRHWWRSHEAIITLGVINILIALNLTWFFIHACSWSQVFGLTLKACR